MVLWPETWKWFCPGPKPWPPERGTLSYLDAHMNTHDAALFLPKWPHQMQLLESIICEDFTRAEQVADNLPTL